MKWRAFIRINLDDLDDWDINDYTRYPPETWEKWDDMEPSSYGGHWYKVEYDDEEDT